jgi:8-oxo-dGTP diphosphatase
MPNDKDTLKLAVDILVFTIIKGKLNVLLIQRRYPPFQGMYASAGGFVEVGESIREAVNRELYEEVGIKDIKLHQLHAFGKPGRDPRGRVVTVSYIGLVNPDKVSPKASDDAVNAKFFPIDDLPKLAFDHEKIIDFGIDALKRIPNSFDIVRDYFEGSFSSKDLYDLYMIIKGDVVNKMAFQRLIESYLEIN